MDRVAYCVPADRARRLTTERSHRSQAGSPNLFIRIAQANGQLLRSLARPGEPAPARRRALADVRIWVRERPDQQRHSGPADEREGLGNLVGAALVIAKCVHEYGQSVGADSAEQERRVPSHAVILRRQERTEVRRHGQEQLPPLDKHFDHSQPHAFIGVP